jgi:hypothetical protein
MTSVVIRHPYLKNVWYYTIAHAITVVSKKLSIRTHIITTLSITLLSITTLRIMTISIKA